MLYLKQISYNSSLILSPLLDIPKQLNQNLDNGNTLSNLV